MADRRSPTVSRRRAECLILKHRCVVLLCHFLRGRGFAALKLVASRAFHLTPLVQRTILAIELTEDIPGEAAISIDLGQLKVFDNSTFCGGHHDFSPVGFDC